MEKQKLKGFTLLELVTIIAIIGILSSIVLVRLNSAREKAKDGKIIAMADSMMTAIQVDARISGTSFNKYMCCQDAAGIGIGLGCSVDAFNFADTNLSNRYAMCDLGWPQLTGYNDELRSKLINSCKAIANANAGPFVFWVSHFGISGLSIIITLPGTEKYYCAGSNGKSSAISNLSDATGPGCSSAWSCPGCPADVLANP